MGTMTDLRTTVSLCGSASGWGRDDEGTGATGFTTFASAGPRVQDTKLHTVADGAINVWPSSLSGPWSG